MALNSNQFALEPVQGEVDMTVTGNQIISAVVSSTEAVALVPGQAVKIVDNASGVPTVTALTANTDKTFGFVVRNPKDTQFAAGAAVEIALTGTVVYMTAGAAIARGAAVEVVYTTTKVITSAGVNPVIGWAFDKATADGSLIRVMIDAATTYTNGSLEQTSIVTATLAEINAGKVLVPAIAGKQIVVTDITERVVGAFAATTSVDVQSSATAVKVSVALVAALTNGAVLKPGDANVSRGAGYAIALPVGEGISIANVGSAATTGTSIAYTITYAVL